MDAVRRHPYSAVLRPFRSPSIVRSSGLVHPDPSALLANPLATTVADSARTLQAGIPAGATLEEPWDTRRSSCASWPAWPAIDRPWVIATRRDRIEGALGVVAGSVKA